ncbi:UV DNA damage repair endonuclease UvsE [Clostridium sp. MB40-C1]|uniref:UV DNA damage repair endonuclease UvsE n=1 Tax=Clostridium sp. MB40-C1 TaxID=3070996 RepID=UPI0027DF2D16|nr:UV DNA damage repair endonuclease UvsE [Clostridium sp. MB40-C1]WMJ82216.1 UV DNA damage repair endonuclease UvsE [Clostridium sp. MB40-C1]
MIKKIGYACINNTLKPRSFQQCRLNSVYKYGIDYLRNKIVNNLNLTKDIIKWNIDNHIFMYRIPSNILPLVEHPDILRDFKWRWQDDQELLNIMNEINNIVQDNNIRLSMHPDQFTVLNSIKRNVVENSINYLNYHYQILNFLGGSDIVIHTGGVYGDKDSAISRFIEVYTYLPRKIKKMLRLENDDISFNIDDVLFISEKTSIPIVLDIHHHRCNNEREISNNDIQAIKNTWDDTGSIPKMHISSGKTGIYDKSHSDYILEQDIVLFASLIENIDVDLMVEAKEKDKAALRLISFLKGIEN